MNASKKQSLDTKHFALGACCGLALLATWIYSLTWVTAELHQGNVYRILYIHVPSAFCAFASSFFLFLFSGLSLRRRKTTIPWPNWAQATAELGLLFTLLTLLTGSIWGRPTWGTWWTWDARLTTTFVLALLYGAYLLLSRSLDGIKRQKACAVLGILIFADVPIVYKSVTWWRTLHQPPSLTLSGNMAMDPEILRHLVLSILVMMLACAWLVWQRSINLTLQAQLEEQSQSFLRRLN